MYDEKLAARVRKVLGPRDDVTERKMFGGLCFMVNGAMCCGVLGKDLIVRVGPERNADALAQPNARPFDFTGRPSKGIVYVSPRGVGDDAALEAWLRRGLSFLEGSAPPGTRTRKSRARSR
jgi:TfoX/Sxy family transcriptional regulator of competence genes